MHQIFFAEDNAFFFRLLLSHLLTDFFLSSIIQIRQKTQLLRDGILSGLLAYVLAGHWQSIWLIFFVGVTHGIIDRLQLKYAKQQPLRAFLVDQLAHVFVLLIAWLYLTDNTEHFSRLVRSIFINPFFMTVLSGYLICTTPIGYVVGMATKKWRDQLSDSSTLDEAGKWIGIAERVVIYSFVLVNQYEAIGFLITAKSLLRFREGNKAAKHSEYVLVGTLLSYALTILTGLLTKLIAE